RCAGRLAPRVLGRRLDGAGHREVARRAGLSRPTGGIRRRDRTPSCGNSRGSGTGVAEAAARRSEARSSGGAGEIISKFEFRNSNFLFFLLRFLPITIQLFG